MSTADATHLSKALAGRYEVQRRIGSGGMAHVYLATDVRHSRAVAIKVMHPELTAALGTDRFLHEIRTTARLTHPHILPLLESGEADGALFYVMPYVEGESLRERIARERQLPIIDAIRIAREVADALSHAHERGVIHRDIKPGNILLEAGHAVLGDFGIARALANVDVERLTVTGLAIGTPKYMSPEQAAGDSTLDPRSDLYSLGCVLFEMLTGEPPFTGSSPRVIILRHLGENVPSAKLLRPAVSDELQHVLDTALAKVPADRVSTAARLRDALDSLIRGETGRSLATSPNLGSMVSRMCNRWNQVNAFEALLREWRVRWPGRPQFYVLYGEEGNGHASLIERLAATRIRQLAHEMVGEERAAVRKVSVPWPVRGKVDVRCRDLAISLFRELDSSYLGHDVSPQAVTRLSSLALTPVVIVDQEIRSKHWDGDTATVLRWYWRQFWSALEGAGEQHPLFIVFIRIVLDSSRPGRGIDLTFGAGRHRRRILRSLEGLGDSDDGGCPVTVLDELGPVTADDVREWFERHGIYQSEQKRQELIDRIFERNRTRKMTLIESSLAQIHRTFVRDVAVSRGEAL